MEDEKKADPENGIENKGFEDEAPPEYIPPTPPTTQLSPVGESSGPTVGLDIIIL